MKVCNFLCFFSLISMTLSAEAENIMDLKRLSLEARNYLKEQVFQDLPQSDHRDVKITSQRLDHRLKLHACDNSLTFEHRRTSKMKGSVAVKVSCHSPYAWSIYTKHKIALEKPIVVAKKNLLKNAVISEQDLGFIQRDIYTQRLGYSLDMASLIGKQVVRPIAKGKIIYSQQLTQAHVIKKGDSVNVTAQVGSLSVITSATALSDGRIGEQIDVENRRSSRIIRVEITGKNAVKVIM